MHLRVNRLLLVLIFLVSIEVWLSFWSQAGGQYHLDLMFWPWKFALPLAAALLTTLMAREFFRCDPEKPVALSRRGILYAALLIAVMLTAGLVTYYYHMNEPPDDDNGDVPTTKTTGLVIPAGQTVLPSVPPGSIQLPDSARVG